VISGNTLQGVTVSGTNTSGNVVEGNYLGLSRTGTNAIPNGAQGVAFFTSASANSIGGTTPGAGNVISGNNSAGVALQVGAINNIVQGNLIGLDWSGTKAIPNVGAGIAITGGSQSNLIGGTSAGSANVLSGNAAQGVVLSDPNTAWNLVQG